jgi:hypothetical protein
MNEPYPPIVNVPEGLSDEAAAALLAFLYDFATALEGHYYAQLRRHENQRNEQQFELWDDPPF